MVGNALEGGGGGGTLYNLNRDAHLRIFLVYPKSNSNFYFKTNVISVLQLR